MSTQGEVVVRIDAEAEVQKIVKLLDAKHEKAPGILRDSINAAARKVRKQMIADALARYAVKDKSMLKKEGRGGPKVFTAKTSNMTAIIRAKGPMQDVMAFVTSPDSGTEAAAAKVLAASALKPLQVGNLKAFVTTFASGHTAVVQRVGDDRMPIKKILSLAVPHMLRSEAVIRGAEKTAYELLQQEIRKRIAKLNDTAAP